MILWDSPSGVILLFCFVLIGLFVLAVRYEGGVEHKITTLAVGTSMSGLRRGGR